MSNHKALAHDSASSMHLQAVVFLLISRIFCSSSVSSPALAVVRTGGCLAHITLSCPQTSPPEDGDVGKGFLVQICNVCNLITKGSLLEILRLSFAALDVVVAFQLSYYILQIHNNFCYFITSQGECFYRSSDHKNWYLWARLAVKVANKDVSVPNLLTE